MKRNFTEYVIARRVFFASIGILAILGISQRCAAQVPDPSHIDVGITPYYYPDSANQLIISVGRFSAGLASTDEKTFLTAIREMKSSWNQLSFPEVYVGAICLYNRGYRWESVYWFYTAAYRGSLFRELIDTIKMGSIGDPSFELYSADIAFHQTVGTYVNGFAGSDLKQLTGSMERALQESTGVPPMYRIYPKVVFVDSASWQSTNSDVAAGLKKLPEYLNSHSAEVAKQRASTGTDTKFRGVTSKDFPLN